MGAPDHSPESHDAVSAAAGEWLARRDRGFTAQEQDAFLEWLHADPRHGAELTRLTRTWRALDSLAAWQPADGAAANPDLLAPPPAHRVSRLRRWVLLASIGLAAAHVWLVMRSPPDPVESLATTPMMRVIPRPETETLADGSIAEINHGAQLEVAFAAEERRVRLREGEVHLTVAKDATRPFVVEAGGVNVRAVGTAFNVRLERDGVDVLVTEGRVLVESPGGAAIPVAGGERARVELRGRPVVTAEHPDAIARDLAWRGERLEFEGLPLRSIVAEFNLRNARQLVIGDAPAGRMKVAGTFRADEPEAFVRLLEAGFGIVVDRRDAGAWVLHSAPTKK